MISFEAGKNKLQIRSIPLLLLCYYSFSALRSVHTKWEVRLAISHSPYPYIFVIITDALHIHHLFAVLVTNKNDLANESL